MSNIRYINTQEIRRDLVGFLKSLESGEEIAVLNRSKVIARLNTQHVDVTARSGIKQMLEAVEMIQSATKAKANKLGPSESYKSRYYKDAAIKYDIS
jgi:antitoxin (DNA-binding transcriptional repressor) of toxin-antitoxin stability system